MPRYKGRFVSDDAHAQLIKGGDGTDVPNMGFHVLVVSIVIALIVIFLIIPECSYKPTERIQIEDLEPDALMLVPNRLIALNTEVMRVNRITGDRTTIKSQDAAQDEIVLAPRNVVRGNFQLMVQGDAIPMHAELLDIVGWLRKSDCSRRAAEQGYLIV